MKKSEYSAFYKTDLEEYCMKNNIDEMYFCGVYSGCCVYFTAVDAAYRKIQPYLIKDASSTEKIGWHKRNYNMFKRLIGPAITTKEVLIGLRKV